MAGYQKRLMLIGPFGKPLFRFLFLLIILGCAGRVVTACQFQRAPEVAHQKPGDLPYGIVPEIPLMAVDKEQLRPAAGLFQPDGFMDFHVWEQAFFAVFWIAVIGMAAILKVFFLFFFPVMVPIEHIQAVLP